MRIKFSATVVPTLCILLCTQTSSTSANKASEQNGKPKITFFTKPRIIFPENENRTNKSSIANDYHLQDSNLVKNGTTLVIERWTSHVVLKCQAAYPVRWNMSKEAVSMENHFPVGFDEYTLRGSEFTGDKPKNKYFESILTITTEHNFLNLNLTCEEVPKTGTSTSLFSSIHLYNSESSTKLENEGKTILVQMPPQKKASVEEYAVTLPCKPAYSGLNVTLEKLDETKRSSASKNDNKSETWIKLSDSVEFDPKVGFKLGKPDISHIKGLYRCGVITNETTRSRYSGYYPSGRRNDHDHIQENHHRNLYGNTEQSEQNGSLEPLVDRTDLSGHTESERYPKRVDTPNNHFVYVNVTVANPAPQEQLVRRKMDLRGNASVTIEQSRFVDAFYGYYPSRTSQLVCCSGIANKPPEVIDERCFNRMHCELMLGVVNQTTLRKPVYTDRYGVPEDQEKGCARVEFYSNNPRIVLCKGVTMDVSEVYTQVFQNDIMPISTRTKILAENKGNGSVFMALKQFTAFGKVEQSTTAILTIGYYPNPNTVHYPHKTRTPNYLPFYGTSYADPDHGSYGFTSIDSRFLQEYPRDFYYETEPLAGICVGLKYYHDEGARIAIRWKNGSRTVIDNFEERKPNTMFFSQGVSTSFTREMDFTHVFSKKVEAHKDMAAMECWLPQKWSEDWDLITKNLTIKEAVPPKIAKLNAEDKAEVVQLTLGENQEKFVECEVTQGAPEPTVSITKEGKWVIEKYNRIREEDEKNNMKVTITRNATNENSAGKEGIVARISFGKVTQDMEGIYQCVAENEKGRDTRTFQVVVKKPTGKQD